MLLAEGFEIFWQKGDNIRDYMQNLLNLYSKGVVYFSSLHASFIFVMFCIFGLGLNSAYMFGILVIKFIDIGFKIYFLDRMKKGLSLGGYEAMLNEDMQISPLTKLASSSFYLFMFYMALNTTGL